MNIFNAGLSRSLFSPRSRERLHCGLDKSVPGKVSASVTEVFAAEEKVGAWGGGHKEPGKAHWIILGLLDHHWCCGSTRLTADNKQHTLLIGHVPKQQRTGPPLVEAPVALEEGSRLVIVSSLQI